eukprot:gene17884-biopygen21899
MVFEPSGACGPTAREVFRRLLRHGSPPADEQPSAFAQRLRQKWCVLVRRQAARTVLRRMHISSAQAPDDVPADEVAVSAAARGEETALRDLLRARGPPQAGNLTAPDLARTPGAGASAPRAVPAPGVLGSAMQGMPTVGAVAPPCTVGSSSPIPPWGVASPPACAVLGWSPVQPLHNIFSATGCSDASLHTAHGGVGFQSQIGVSGTEVDHRAPCLSVPIPIPHLDG